MKKVLIAAALAAIAAVPTMASANEAVSGTIAIPNPATAVVGGITEAVDACNPEGDTQGLDGYWIAITPGQTLTATPTGAGAAITDLDVWFYDAGCNGLFEASPADVGPGVAESAPIPEVAAWVIIDLFAGPPNAGFDVTFS